MGLGGRRPQRYNIDMTTVNITDIEQNLPGCLRRVEAGETIEVTDRGRPVALLAPLSEGSALERLKRLSAKAPA